MRLLGVLLATVLLGGGAAAQARPGRQSGVAACEQEWQAMAQLHRAQADVMRSETSGYRALLVMLRNDAGTVRNDAIRDGLQVNADMWEKLLGTLERQAASLQQLAQQEESRRQALCRSLPNSAP
jgi:hypothetical protein